MSVKKLEACTSDSLETTKNDNKTKPHNITKDNTRSTRTIEDNHTYPLNRGSRNHKRKLSLKECEEQYNQSIITNLSNVPLTHNQLKVLSHGLKFIPTQKPLNFPHILKSLKEFRRKMYLQFFFQHDISDPHPFRAKSDWEAPTPTNPNLVAYHNEIEFAILSLMTHQALTNTELPRPDNLTEDEWKALYELEKIKNIVIKPADKGGGIVVMNRTDYDDKVRALLSNKNHYTLIDSNPLPKLINDIVTYTTHLFLTGRIDSDTFKFMSPNPSCHMSYFYILPKIHKPGIPGRPIVASCEYPTSQISAFIDHFLQQIVVYIPSYLKDSTHFLCKVLNFKGIPDKCLLVTCDVISLYTNIPQDEGINTVIHWIDNYRHILPSYTPANSVFKRLLNFVLKHNYFIYNNSTYHQLQGVAMGTKMAPSFANLFMGKLEADFLRAWGSDKQPFLWLRFIDDIFFLWQHGETALKEFMTFINNFHKTIKFEYSSSPKQINFLDTTIFFNSIGKLESKLYVKPTDRTMLLAYHSFHPQPCKHGIIYSQALRYRRLTTSNDILKASLKRLRKILLIRGYKSHHIDHEFTKVYQFTQNDLLTTASLVPKRLNSSTFPVTPPLILPYDPICEPINQILKEHWHYIEEDPRLKHLWPSKPFLSLKRRRNLKDRLVRAKISIP